MIDKFLVWLTYKLLYMRIAMTKNCCGAVYENNKHKEYFDVWMKERSNT